MKTITLGFILYAVTMFSAYTHKEVTPMPTPEQSWKAFCEIYRVSESAPTEEEVNYYLDCWCGSVEEEKALESLD